MLYEFEAIGTRWWLERLDNAVFTDELKHEIEQYTSIFDKRYSRFRDDSLVAELAQNGILHNPPAEMLQMLDYAKDMYVASDGALDMLVGNDLQNLGYGRVAAGRAGPAERQFDKLVTWNRAVVKVPIGTVLEFGGFGKGWLIDEYAKILRQHKVSQFIVNGGGDLFCQSNQPITFAMQDPYDSDKKIGDASLTVGALAASSTIKRAWEHNGEHQHHIIDPKTGKPSDSSVVASFVIADTALIADTLATILIIRPQLDPVLIKNYKVQTKLVYSRPVTS